MVEQRKLTKPVDLHNVSDGRHGWIGAWQVVPLVYEHLTDADIGRTVIYQDVGRAQAGTLTGWRRGIVFARFSRGDTAAGCSPESLMFGVAPLDGDLTRAALSPVKGDGQ